jgi:DNA-binding response OmpR family regulator
LHPRWAEVALCIIVEDHRDTREGYAEYIGLSGFSVLSAPGADELRRLLNLQVPDVIVMDLQLPGTDGWDLIREIKKDRRTCQVPVLVVSGWVRVVDREGAFKAGADGFVGKPCLPMEIVTELRRLVDRPVGQR